jgi:adenine phosphoribosyltransferase
MDDLSRVKAAIKEYPDFPKKGIMFQDVFGILSDPAAHESLHRLMAAHAIKHKDEVDVVAGLDARGVLLGPAMALAIGKPFVPVRKAGKLPGGCIGQSYSLEYGEDRLEVQEGSIQPGARVLLVDDLLATGGTLGAACGLVTRCGGAVAHCWVVIELAALGGRARVGHQVQALVTMEDVV